MRTFFNRFRFTRELKRLIRENPEQDKPLSVLNDIAFKAMLSSDNADSRKALRSLLSACIRREVANVKIVNNELLPAHLAAKLMRLDIRVTFNDGEVADLEMQIGQSDDDLKMRAAVYAAMLIAGQTRRGRQYKETKRVYQIFFLNCVLFKNSDKLPRRYGYREETEGDLLTNGVEIMFYELPKLEQRLQEYLTGKAETKDLRDDEKWCIFMKYRHEEQAKPLITELCRKEEGIMQAEKVLKRESRSFLKYMREIDAIKNEMERYYMKKNARAEGLAEGLAEGKAEGHAEKLEIARKMKTKGLPLAEIVDITGLSTEAVEHL